MSEFYIIGENRQIAAVNDASLVRSVVVDDVIYTYWRHSEVVGDDNTAVIKMSSSADGVTWTTPVTVYDPSALDPLLGGVTHNGTNFYLAVGEKNTTTGAVTTKILRRAHLRGHQRHPELGERVTDTREDRHQVIGSIGGDEPRHQFTS